MMWRPDQQARLKQERKWLAARFPALQWYGQTNSENTWLNGPIVTNSGRAYQIALSVPSDFPDSCPTLLVTDPAPLLDCFGQRLPDVSVTMHTIGRMGECTKICHYQPALWTPDNTLYLVAIKGRIWLEAYDAHLRTGRPLDTYLRHMRTPLAVGTQPSPAENSEEGMFIRLLRRIGE